MVMILLYAQIILLYCHIFFDIREDLCIITSRIYKNSFCFKSSGFLLHIWKIKFISWWICFSNSKNHSISLLAKLYENSCFLKFKLSKNISLCFVIYFFEISYIAGKTSVRERNNFPIFCSCNCILWWIYDKNPYTHMRITISPDNIYNAKIIAELRLW